MALADLLGLSARPRLRSLADLIGGDWRPPLLPPGIAGPVNGETWRPPLLRPPDPIGSPDAVQASAPEPAPLPGQPARARLADLLEQLGAAPPAAPDRFRDLAPDQRRAANMQALGMLAQAIGGAQPGRLGSSLGAAAAALPAQRQAMVEQERERMAAAEEDRRRRIADEMRIVEAQRALDDERAAEEAEEQRRAAVAERAGRLLNAIGTLAPEGDPLREQAAVAASEGDLKGLNTILADARRAAALRAQGVDPNDPLAEEEMKRRRGLGPYYEPPPKPQRPESYAPEIETFADGVYLVDRNAGTRRFLGPSPESASETTDPEIGLRKAAYDETLRRMRAAEEADKPFNFNREMESELARRRDAMGLPIPTSPGLPAVDPDVLRAGGTAKVYPVNPKPRRRAATPPGVPTSDATAPAAQPKGTADDVLSKLPTDIKVNPEAKRFIEEDLAAGRSVQEILNELLLERAERIIAAQEAAALAGGV